MVRKPAKMYRAVKSMAYTRREYMGGVPNLRIAQFNTGNIKGEFPVVLSLRVKERVQVRHTALEAGRISANRYLQKRAGTMNYHLNVHVYPHIVLRENKMATGAGADRISSGMRQAFGKAVGTAARMKPGEAVYIVRTTPQHFLTAKTALRKAAMKMPTPCRITVDQGADLIKM